MINFLGIVTITAITFIGAMNEKTDENNCLQLEVQKREEIFVKVLNLMTELPRLTDGIQSMEEELGKEKYRWYSYENERSVLLRDIDQYKVDLEEAGRSIAMQTEELIDGLKLTPINCKYDNSSEPKDTLKRFHDQTTVIEELSEWICDVKTEDIFDPDDMYPIVESLKRCVNPEKISNISRSLNFS